MSSLVLLGDETRRLLSEAMGIVLSTGAELANTPLTSKASADFIRRCMALKARIKARNADPEISNLERDLNNQRMTTLHNIAMLEASINLQKPSGGVRLFADGHIVLVR